MAKAQPLKAVLFDFNGVIVDDEALHTLATQRALRAHGVLVGEHEVESVCLGRRDEECLEVLLRDCGVAIVEGVIDELIAAKRRHYHELIADQLREVPGVRRLIVELSDAGLALGVCSGSPRSEVEPLLEAMGLRRFFSAVVCGEDVLCGKPAPEGYLSTLAQLAPGVQGQELRPRECVVIEDSPAGVRAALRAGMWCLALATSLSPNRLAEADRVETELAGISLLELEHLVTPPQ